MKEYSLKAGELRRKRKALEEELVEFYTRLLRKALEYKPEKLYFMGYFNRDKGRIVSVDEGIVVEKGIPYYINTERGVKIELISDEDIKLAIREIFGELLLLEDPRQVVSNVIRQVARSGGFLRSIRFKR